MRIERPRTLAKTLADVFPDNDSPSPSPPHKNIGMDIEEVHARMRSLLPWLITPENMEANFPDKYKKLCYVIGQDLDKFRGIQDFIVFFSY
jgi:hypothetical protein